MTHHLIKFVLTIEGGRFELKTLILKIDTFTHQTKNVITHDLAKFTLELLLS